MKNNRREGLVDLLEQADGQVNNDIPSLEMIADYLIANDVVPVVRCKDCKHCDHFYPRCDKDGTLEEMYSCMMFDYIVQPDCYCSYGERKI